MKYTTTAESGLSDGVKVLTYAEAGGGKTMLCATAPSPVIISAESGLLSLQRKNIERVYGVGTPGIAYDIPVIVVESFDDLDHAYNAVLSGSFGTVCLDSLSEIAEVCLANEKKATKDPRKAYGETQDKMLHTVRKFRDIRGMHVYMTAKMEYVKDDVTGAMRWGPSMPGTKLSQMLPYYFDEVWRLVVVRDKEGRSARYLQTQPDQSSTAKDRSGSLEMWELPYLGSCFTKILGV